jgi:phosphoribosylcarboxyaminoimidazole (NCAIR) mutase
VRESELRIGKRSKEYIRLMDTVSGEIVVSAELTPAAVKRIIKEYSRYGYELMVA